MKSSLWVGYALAVALSVILGRAQLKLKAREGEVWWASTGRDVLNGLALALMVGGLWTLGLSLPVGLAVAAVNLLLMTAIQDVSDRMMQPLKGSIVSWLVGLAVLIAPHGVEKAMRWLWQGLFMATKG